jgi:two-component system response regulator MtrA
MWKEALEMPLILIIDDDLELTALVRTMLSKDGYEVEIANDGQSGLEKLEQLQPDLILLDIMMPGMDGWAVCQQIRERSDSPIIFLSALGAERDIVRGLKSGADDYVPKPFRRDELLARIEAVLRRTISREAARGVVFRRGDLVIDQPRWEVRRGEELIHLTPTEFRLLLLLAKNGGRPVSHRKILVTVWGDKHEGNLNLLKVYIRQLRQKIEHDPDHPQYIMTKRGVGYQLADIE